MKPNASPTTVLMTGFGPFPGVTNNISADLAAAVCARLNEETTNTRFESVRATAYVLPVAWHSVSRRLEYLYQHHAPHLAIHFGVSESATGLVVERAAHNACCGDCDVEGRTPTRSVLQDDAAQSLTTRLPVRDIIAACAGGEVKIVPSDDAGRYLCNAAYYISLSLAARQKPASDALFIHVPASLRIVDTDWRTMVDAAVSLVGNALSTLPARAH